MCGRTAAATALAVTLLLLAPATSRAGSVEHPDFSGLWRVNTKLSGSPIERMPTREPLPPGTGVERGGGSMGSGDLAPYAGRRGQTIYGNEPQEMPAPPELHDRVRDRSERMSLLRVEHKDPRLSITYADDSERTLYTDGRPFQPDFENGILDGRVRWKKRRLVIRVETPDDRLIVETWELSKDGRQLYVQIEMDALAGMPEMSIRRVYDSIEASEATD